VINPRDIHGYYDLHSKIRVGNTQDQISRGMHAAFMRDKKLWSRDRAMEYAGVAEPWDEYKTIMRDTLEESPLVQQISLSEALKQEPEIAARAGELEAQGIDIMGMLTGMMQGGGVPPSTQSAATPAGSAAPGRQADGVTEAAGWHPPGAPRQ